MSSLILKFTLNSPKCVFLFTIAPVIMQPRSLESGLCEQRATLLTSHIRRFERLPLPLGKLKRMVTSVCTFLFEQSLMCSALNNSSVFNHHYLIGMLNR